VSKSELESELCFQMATDSLPEPAQEHRFHATRKWRFDFAWPEFKVACEVEGGTWADGRHTRGLGFQRDCTKYNEAALLGWLVLRVTGHHIETGKALLWIRRALTARGWSCSASS